MCMHGSNRDMKHELSLSGIDTHTARILDKTRREHERLQDHACLSLALLFFCWLYRQYE